LLPLQLVFEAAVTNSSAWMALLLTSPHSLHGVLGFHSSPHAWVVLLLVVVVVNAVAGRVLSLQTRAAAAAGAGVGGAAAVQAVLLLPLLVLWGSAAPLLSSTPLVCLQ
jgi:hypothetical protein